MPDTPPVAITVTVDDRLEPLCDFCGATDPIWRYPCADFDLPGYDSGSSGAWGACAICAEIIETIELPIHGNPTAIERMADLSARALDRVDPDARGPLTEGRLAAIAFLFALHLGFFEHRRGPRRRDAAFRPDESATGRPTE